MASSLHYKSTNSLTPYTRVPGSGAISHTLSLPRPHAHPAPRPPCTTPHPAPPPPCTTPTLHHLTLHHAHPAPHPPCTTPTLHHTHPAPHPPCTTPTWYDGADSVTITWNFRFLAAPCRGGQQKEYTRAPLAPCNTAPRHAYNTNNKQDGGWRTRLGWIDEM